ncbi:MAG: hypothetical protein P9F19_12205 [Candidatus Contendobacter sp.]|nr:hypothetical protein [Candidatus Contendobacter sp.]MDG4558131.1 hypothetical protein [Candidatus Contendobacter sp.]
MNHKMKRRALAVGIMLGGLSLAPTAGAVSVAANNLGQALIFPYYTVRGGWTTLLGVVNTSNQVVAVKVRFRESYNSRDVFDFNLILSPLDEWTAWVTDSPNGPVIHTEDSSCTVGNIVGAGAAGVTFPAPVSYTGNAADGGPTTVDRMREGYVEMIMMGAAPVGAAVTPDPFPLARGAIHVNGATPPGCAALAAFQDPTRLGTYDATAFPCTSTTSGTSNTLRGEFCNYARDSVPDTQRGWVPLDPLKGTFALVNGALGFNAVGLPTALANFREGRNNGSMMTLQLPPNLAGSGGFSDSWHEPSLYSANTPGAALNLIDEPVYSIANGRARTVSFALEKTNVINEWSRRTNAAAGWVTATDWVFTFPTKNFFVDNDPSNEFAGRNTGRGNAITSPGPASAGPFTQTFVDTSVDPAVRRGMSCDPLLFTLLNREEQASQGAGFSPGGNPQLCYEANVLTFNRSSSSISAGTSRILDASSTGGILGSPNAVTINFPENFSFGWMDVRFVNVNNQRRGLPVVGFAITSRDDQSGLLSEAALVDHSSIRTFRRPGDGCQGDDCL